MCKLSYGQVIVCASYRMGKSSYREVIVWGSHRMGKLSLFMSGHESATRSTVHVSASIIIWELFYVEDFQFI